jgi:hypothetical protein
MLNEEADRFRQIQLGSEVERAKNMIVQYRAGIDFYRDKIDLSQKLLGHVGERLGEPEEERPR